MIPISYVKLINMINHKMSSNEIVWNRVSESCFKLSLESSTVVIDKWKERDYLNEVISIDIYDINGKIISRLSCSSRSEEQEDYYTLHYLYDNIYRYNTNNVYNTGKVEETITRIITELNQSGMNGK